MSPDNSHRLPHGDIMVVEDNMSDLKLLSDILTKAGYHVRPATDGELTLRSVQAKLPDLILMDIKMPGLSGVEVCRRLKADPETRDLPIIFISALDETELKVKALEVGGIDYISKPIEPSEVLARINIHINTHRLQQKLTTQSEELIAEIEERKQVEEELKNSQYQLRRLAQKLQFVREEERTWLAGEIHDELGQALTALQMDISMLMKKLNKGDKESQDKLNSMLELIETITSSVQRISMDLRPGLLEDLGLMAAIEWQSEEFQKKTGIECQLALEKTKNDLDQGCSVAIYRMYQEALTNIIRHAGATQVKVVLEEQDENIVLEITDNGKGISREQIASPDSLGIIGMRERCLSCDGELTLAGTPGKGTKVMIKVPMG